MTRFAIAVFLALLACTVDAQVLTGLTTLGAAPANNDYLIVVDVSDTTMAGTGTTKKITTANLFAYSGSFGGTAALATALAANGANCSAGSAPLGVDASGAAESCTAYQASDADLTSWAAITRGTGFDTAAAINIGSAGALLVKGTSVCADLSNGATGCSTATGTSGATLPLLNGANTWSAAQSDTIDDSGTNTIVYPYVFGHTSSGTATTAFGVGVKAQAESGSGTTRDIGTQEWLWKNATNGAEDADVVFSVISDGTLAEAFRIHSQNGNFNKGDITITGPVAAYSIQAGNGQMSITNGTGAAFQQVAMGSIISTGTIQAAVGSAAAPAFIITGNATYGLYWDSVNGGMAMGANASRVFTATNTNFALAPSRGITGDGTNLVYGLVPYRNAKTTDYTLTGPDAGTFNTNSSASGDMVFTLPACSTTSLEFQFAVTAAHYLKVKAVGSDVVNNGGVASAGAGYIRSTTVGHSVKVSCAITGVWMVSAITGTWTVDL